MLDPASNRRSHYEDVFRALGHYLDEHHFKDIVILESAEGFILKGNPFLESGPRDVTQRRRTFLFTDADIDAVLEAAYTRRRSAHGQHKGQGRRGWLRKSANQMALIPISGESGSSATLRVCRPTPV